MTKQMKTLAQSVHSRIALFVVLKIDLFDRHCMNSANVLYV